MGAAKRAPGPGRTQSKGSRVLMRPRSQEGHGQQEGPALLRVWGNYPSSSGSPRGSREGSSAGGYKSPLSRPYFQVLFPGTPLPVLLPFGVPCPEACCDLSGSLGFLPARERHSTQPYPNWASARGSGPLGAAPGVLSLAALESRPGPGGVSSVGMLS